MINKNILSNTERAEKVKPFLLRPAGKDYLWGGGRLKDEFGKNIDLTPLAETWECSTHPDGQSVAASGIWKGRSLTEILQEHPEYLGIHPETSGELPVLVKLIDARQDLSLQVHPDDAYAKKYEKGQLGKTEMWYVLDATSDATLVYGLAHDTDQETLHRSILDGTIEKHLQKVPVKKDDVYFLEAGTIHAIGAGIVIAEIQENSDLTYRLYDYDRVDQNGQKRRLHIEKALAVANLKKSREPVQPMRVLKYRHGWAAEFLCRCKYFEVQRILLNTERCRKMVSYHADSMSFRIFLCIGGCGVILMEDGDSICFFKGDCIFFPAESEEVKIHGKAQIIDVRG